MAVVINFINKLITIYKNTRINVIKNINNKVYLAIN